MTVKHHQSLGRILAIDPSKTGFGFVVLEGVDQLLDWGVAKVWSKQPTAFVARIDGFVERWQPTIVVLEELATSRRGTTARTQIGALIEYAQSKELSVELVSRRTVQRVFERTGSRKFDIALTIAATFPELSARLPRLRKPWRSEDERMNIFDAASFALALLLRSN
jgi:hypothetical protein